MSVWIVLSLWYLMQRTVQDNSFQLMGSKLGIQSIPVVFSLKITEHSIVSVEGKGLACVPQLAYESQRAVCRNLFFSSTMRILKIKLKHQAWWQDLLPIKPSCWPKAATFLLKLYLRGIGYLSYLSLCDRSNLGRSLFWLVVPGSSLSYGNHSSRNLRQEPCIHSQGAEGDECLFG